MDELKLKRCPHCNIASPHIRLQGNFIGEGGRYHWGLYQCQSCQKAITARIDCDATTGIQKLDTCFPKIENQILEAEAVPENIRKDLQEAFESTPSASIMMTNRALDMMLVDRRGYDDDTLSFYQKIEKALEDNLITEDISKWAHKIRLDSNVIRHKKTEGNNRPTSEQAQQALKFAQTLAEILYIFPSLIPKEEEKEEVNKE